MATQTRVQIPLDQLKQTIQQRLKERGGVGIRALARSFQIMDDNRNKNLDRYEFSKALTDMGIPVNKMVCVLLSFNQ